MFNFQVRVAALCLYSAVFFSMLACVAVREEAAGTLIVATAAPSVHGGYGIDAGPSVPSAADVFNSGVWSSVEDVPTF